MIGQLEKDLLFRWASLCIDPALALKTHFPDHQLIERSDLSLQRQEIPGSLTVQLHNGESVRVDCHHPLVLIPTDAAATQSAALLTFKTSGTPEENSDLWLAGTLQWLAEANVDSPLSLCAVQLNRGNMKDKSADVQIAFLDCKKTEIPLKDKMEEWLCSFITQMIIDRHSEHLPFSAVQKLWPSLSLPTLAAHLETGHTAYNSYLPAFKLIDAQLPDLTDEALNTLVLSRYAPLLEEWISLRKVPV